MSGITVANAAAVEAVINAAASTITLYTTSGTPVEVPVDKADELLLIGFRRNKLTLDNALVALVTALGVARDAASDLVIEIGTAGQYDPNAGAYVAAFLAIREIERAWADYRLAVDAHPAKESGTAVRMLNLDGADVQIDPAQVEHYQALGFRMAKEQG